MKSNISHDSEYWDVISCEYDSLYRGKWSQLENKFIQNQLSDIIFDGCSVLDLGCGTGLGYQLCSSISSNISYTGLDFSAQMLEVFRESYPNVKTVHGSMNDLSMFQPATFDVVISTFSAFSFVRDSKQVPAEIFRMLKPGGIAFITCLSKYSLRRLFKLMFTDTEEYCSRESKNRKSTKATVYTKNRIKELFESCGLEVDNVSGYNPFGGITNLENMPGLWGLNQVLGKYFINLSHELIIKSKKSHAM